MALDPEKIAKLRALADKPRAPGAKLLRAGGVRESSEFHRIARIPRRPLPTPDPVALSLALLREGSEWRLRPIQVAALEDLAAVGGLVAPIRVGGGKTLISLLAGRVLEAERPLLVVPAKLAEKTRAEFERLAREWWVDVHPRVVSYELLGREQAADLLREYTPDLLILDEAHRAKNPKAAVTKRIRRYVEEVPSCRVVVMSGTLLNRSITEAAHLLEWALAERSPLPRKWAEINEWAQAVDEKLAPGAPRLNPGALVQLCGPDEARELADDETAAIRKAVRRRITETPGVVATDGAFLGASLRIELHRIEGYSAETEAAFDRLQSAWETPDGFPVPDAASVYRHAVELAQGFYYVWDPRPPREWLDARREWFQASRHILDHNRSEIDTELQVRRAVDRGDYDGRTLVSGGLQIGSGAVPEILARWRTLGPTFEPNTIPVWLDQAMIEWAIRWAAEAPGIVWVSSVALGEALAARGLPYYGRKAQDAQTGRAIATEPGTRSIVASIASCGEGQNLQAFSRNLVISGTLSGGAWEQLLGRTHREGQTAEEVTFDVAIGCAAQYNGFLRALRDAEFAEHTQGQTQKLLYADRIDPGPGVGGGRWT